MSRRPCSTLQLHIDCQPTARRVSKLSMSSATCNIHSGLTPRGLAGSDAASAVLARMGNIKANEETCFLPIFNVVEAIGGLRLQHG